jgi:DNA polymerase III sliding clamp (beta) subunit (PCNA family)
LPHVSVEASRPILNGVLLEPAGVVVATNGRTLAAHKFAASGVTRPVILAFPKLPAKAATLEFPMPENGDSTPIVARVLSASGLELDRVIIREVEGPFPAWRNVFPASDAKPIPAIGIDPELVARFAVKNGTGKNHLLTTEPVAFEFFHAESAVRVTYPKNDDFAGLIMPTRLTVMRYTGWVARFAAWEPIPSVD